MYSQTWKVDMNNTSYLRKTTRTCIRAVELQAFRRSLPLALLTDTLTPATLPSFDRIPATLK